MPESFDVSEYLDSDAPLGMQLLGAVLVVSAMASLVNGLLAVPRGALGILNGISALGFAAVCLLTAGAVLQARPWTWALFALVTGSWFAIMLVVGSVNVYLALTTEDVMAIEDMTTFQQIEGLLKLAFPGLAFAYLYRVRDVYA